MRRSLLRLTLLSIVACITVSGGLWAQDLARVPDNVELLRDVEYGTGDGRPLRMHISMPKPRPEQPQPVIVWIHGGAWLGGSRDGGLGRMMTMTRQGYVCAAIEYRFSSEAIFPAQIHDCKCAIRFLRAHADQYGIDPDRIGVWGSSAGGHLVSLLGTSAGVKELEGDGGWAEFSSEVQAVCNFSGPTDFVAWGENSHPAVRILLGGTVAEKPELARQASPVTYASKTSAPTLIMHGEKDDVVPVSQAHRLHEVLKQKQATVTLFLDEQAGHHLAGPEVSQTVTEFFEKHLKARK